MSETDVLYFDWLVRECGYQVPRVVGGGRCAYLHVRSHNTQLIVGRIGDLAGYDDAW